MTKDRKNGASTPIKVKNGGKSIKDIELKDCPLTLEKVHMADISKCVNYLKKDGDGIGLDDLNNLQFQLEAALVTTVTRKNHLVDELDILQNIEKHKGRSRKVPGSPNKRSSSRDTLAGAKKLKLNTGKTIEPKSGKTKVPFSEQDDDDDILKPGSAAGSNASNIKSPQQSFLPKNDTPQRFWNFVEPYCAPIQASDVKFLEDLIKGYNEIGEFYKIPGLGPHYSIRWAKEDLEREQNKSSEASEDDKAGAKFEGKNDSVPFGDLTQRLIQGLMEEKQSSTEDNIDRSMEPCGSRNSFIQSLKVSQDGSLEKQIKKELEEMGILTSEEIEGGEGATASGGDEVLAELERCQAELKAVAAHNVSSLRNLNNLARVEMARQEIRVKLEEADNEVKDSYSRISAARVKKRALTKKEKDSAWKSIKDREIILKQLESI